MPFPGDGGGNTTDGGDSSSDPSADPSAGAKGGDDERGMAVEATGYDAMSSGLKYRRVAPFGMHFHLEEGRERWLSQMATTRLDSSGQPAASTSRVYHEFPTRDNDPFPYGQFGQFFLIPCTRPDYGKDEDGHPLHRLVMGINKAWLHHNDRVQGPMHHIGEQKWPQNPGTHRQVDMLWDPDHEAWHWRAYTPDFGGAPPGRPNPGRPSTPVPPTAPGAPVPSGGTPGTQPTGGGTGGGGTPTQPTGGGTTGPSSRGGGPGYDPSNPWGDAPIPPFTEWEKPWQPWMTSGTTGADGGGSGTSQGGTGGGGGGGGGSTTSESPETFEAMMVTEDFDRDEFTPAGPVQEQMATGEVPNEGDGIATVRAVWNGRTWPGDGFWQSGFRPFTARPNSRWPADGWTEDPGEIAEQIVTPDFLQETLEALTRFTQDEFDWQRTETAWKDIAERINALSDYVANLDQRHRSDMPERQTVTVLAGNRTIVTTTLYDYVGTVPAVQATVVGPYGVDIVSYADSGNKRQATLQLTGTANADTEISVQWTYSVARATEVAVGSGV